MGWRGKPNSKNMGKYYKKKDTSSSIRRKVSFLSHLPREAQSSVEFHTVSLQCLPLVEDLPT